MSETVETTMLEARAIDANRRRLYKKALELTDFVAGKDNKYAGKVLCGNIRDLGETWGIEPSKWCSMRINEKVNRMRKNPNSREVHREELRDIFGYALLGLVLMEEQK